MNTFWNDFRKGLSLIFYRALPTVVGSEDDNIFVLRRIAKGMLVGMLVGLTIAGDWLPVLYLLPWWKIVVGSLIVLFYLFTECMVFVQRTAALGRKVEKDSPAISRIS